MLKDAIEARRAEQDQEADCARIDAAIGSSEQDIAALEDLQLEPGEIQRQWASIRDRTILEIRDLVHNVVTRANEARKTTEHIIQNSSCQPSDARVVDAFSVALREVPTSKLVDYVRYLAEIGDRARTESVRGVFAERKDRHAYEAAFSKVLVQFALPEYGDVNERVGSICRLAEKVDARIANLFGGYSITDRSRAHARQQLARVDTLGMVGTSVDQSVRDAAQP
jgi:hypothetical protein